MGRPRENTSIWRASHLQAPQIVGLPLSAFTDELSKISQAKKKDQDDVDLTLLEQNTGVGAVLLGLLGMAAGSAVTTTNNPESRALAEKVLEKARSEGIETFTSSSVGPHYSPSNHHINSPISYGGGVAAHEFGHARGRSTSLLRKIFADSKPGQLSRAALAFGGPAMIAGLLDRFVESKRQRPRDSKKQAWYGEPARSRISKKEHATLEKVLGIGGGIGTAAFAPVLIEEARATAQVPGILKSLSASKGRIVKETLKLLPAYATYLAAAGAPLVPWALYRRGRKLREKKDRKRKLLLSSGLKPHKYKRRTKNWRTGEYVYEY